jgi:hypothetical protein
MSCLNHAFTRQRALEISCFFAPFSCTDLTGSSVMTMRHVCRWCMCCLKPPQSIMSCLTHLSDYSTLAKVANMKAVKCAYITINSKDLGVLSTTQIHVLWQWLWERIYVGYLYGLESGISQWLKHLGRSWQNERCEIRVRTNNSERMCVLRYYDH